MTMTQRMEYAPSPAAKRDAIAWAVIDGGKIKVNTVSDTRRAAMINMSDEQIDRMWFRWRNGAEIEYVTVVRAHDESLPVKEGQMDHIVEAGWCALQRFRQGDSVAHITMGDGIVTRVTADSVHVRYGRSIGIYDLSWFRLHPKFLFHRNTKSTDT